MPQLCALMVQYGDPGDEHSHLFDLHPAVLDRDLESLTQLQHLCLSQTARCYARVFESGLPQLRTLVLRDFGPRAVGVAVLRRMERDGLAVFMDHVNYWSAPPRQLSVTDLEAMIPMISSRERRRRRTGGGARR